MLYHRAVDFLFRHGTNILLFAGAWMFLNMSDQALGGVIGLILAFETLALTLTHIACYTFTPEKITREHPIILAAVFLGVHGLIGLVVLASYIAKLLSTALPGSTG